MNVIIKYIEMNVRRQMIYGKNLIGELILSSCYYILQFVFIEQISSFSGGLGSYSRDEVNLIFIVFILLGILLSVFTNSIEFFFEEVAEGKIEAYLTKPVSAWVLMLVGWCKPLNIINLVVIASCAFTFVSLPDTSLINLNWMLFSVSLICIFIINICFFLIFNFMTFITSRKMPVEYFHEMIYELSFIPIALYPSSIVKWLLFILPMSFSASLPVSLLLDKNEWNIEYILLSTLITTLVTFICYRVTISKFNGLGG